MAQKTHKITQEPLGSNKAIATHHEIINHEKAYSLTFNISKHLMNHNMKDQYMQGRNAILRVFKNLSSLFTKGMVSLEFNKNKNAHFHSYFISNCETSEMLRDAIKTYIPHEWQSLWTSEGNGWRLKVIDSITDELSQYPFKDIPRTQLLVKCSYKDFEAKHTIFERMIPTFKPRKNYETATTRAIDIFLKFMEDCNKVKDKYETPKCFRCPNTNNLKCWTDYHGEQYNLCLSCFPKPKVTKDI